MKLAGDFWKSKVTWTGFAAVVTAVGAVVSHAVDPVTGIVGIFAALQTIFIRDALKK